MASPISRAVGLLSSSLRSRLATPGVSLNAARQMSGEAAVIEGYSPAMKVMHWFMAGGILGVVGTVQMAMSQPKTKEGNEARGKLMNAHKSFGLLMAIAIPVRLALRFTSKIPAPLPGATWEHMAATAAHWALYGGMIVMPASGVAMGYFGGKGLPFFGMTIPGASKPNGAIAKNTFKVHKQVGQYWKYVIPAHVAGSVTHFAKGQAIYTRMNPFAKTI
eukprot:CAMPEP_0114141802 /NCGR_PEP_ID=MMETSP0043_2-20121206/18104_1 /TAXON_ID=464988 /ORGANISM="Hemiselmis andersenii, Strain CCMP644" /LENGTH=218 /DNA_ID=CAMNT_0001235971 /DNA_START=47 /DNA_END=703 /DNA_ORIENTATION=-